MKTFKVEKITILTSLDAEAIASASKFLKGMLRKPRKVTQISVIGDLTKVSPKVMAGIITNLSLVCEKLVITTDGVNLGNLSYFNNFISNITIESFNKLYIDILLDGANIVHTINNKTADYFETYKGVIHCIKSRIKVRVVSNVTKTTLEYMKEMKDWLRFMDLVWGVRPVFLYSGISKKEINKWKDLIGTVYAI